MRHFANHIIVVALIIGPFAPTASARGPNRTAVLRLIQQQQQQFQAAQKKAQEQAAQRELQHQQDLARRKQAYDAHKEHEKQQREEAKKARLEAKQKKEQEMSAGVAGATQSTDGAAKDSSIKKDSPK